MQVDINDHICTLHVILTVAPALHSQKEEIFTCDAVWTFCKPCTGDLDGALSGLEGLNSLKFTDSHVRGTLPVGWPKQLPSLQTLILAANLLIGIHSWDGNQKLLLQSFCANG